MNSGEEAKPWANIRSRKLRKFAYSHNFPPEAKPDAKPDEKTEAKPAKKRRADAYDREALL